MARAFINRPPVAADPDNEFMGYDLTPHPHDRHQKRQGATIPDDGLIDEVAIDRFLVHGIESVRLTPREVLAAFIKGRALGISHGTLSALFGKPFADPPVSALDHANRAWTQRLREQIERREIVEVDDTEVA